MSTCTVTDFSLFINQHKQSQQTLRESLSKACALLQVSLESEILQHPNITVYFYLWCISDLVEQSRELNEHMLSKLLITEKHLAQVGT